MGLGLPQLPEYPPSQWVTDGQTLRGAAGKGWAALSLQFEKGLLSPAL